MWRTLWPLGLVLAGVMMGIDLGTIWGGRRVDAEFRDMVNRRGGRILLVADPDSEMSNKTRIQQCNPWRGDQHGTTTEPMCVHVVPIPKWPEPEIVPPPPLDIKDSTVKAH